MLNHLDVPDDLPYRGSARAFAAGMEHTGQILVELATRRAGLESLQATDVLDVGCATRITQAIVNRSIPIGSYTGIEVDRAIYRFLKTAVEPFDSRFHFAYWDVRNAKYNPDAEATVATSERLPVEGDFDLIWLLSVLTHQEPADAAGLLRLTRQVIRPDGKLFFSALIDDDLDGFEDRDPEHPLLWAYYGRRTMDEMVRQAGWVIDSFHQQDPDHFILPSYVCSPAP